MSCRHPRTEAQMFVDGELAAEARLRFEHHLPECDTCRIEVEQLHAYRHTLSEALPEVQAPAALRARLLAWSGGEPESNLAHLPRPRMREMRA